MVLDADRCCSISDRLRYLRVWVADASRSTEVDKGSEMQVEPQNVLRLPMALTMVLTMVSARVAFLYMLGRRNDGTN